MFECDCGGTISQYSAKIRRCKKCNRIMNIEELLKLLRELSINEKTIDEIEASLVVWPNVFHSKPGTK